MIRFLANENFPIDAVKVLRQTGYDVLWIRMESPGLSDQDVLRCAIAEQRILLTFDKDFGELAFHAGLPTGCGIVLFRIMTSSSPALAAIVLAAIQSRTDWTGHFSVVEPGRIRMRPLPLPHLPAGGTTA